MSKITGPLFKWFGSKWLSAKKLPLPLHDIIIEPFAGSAGYSLRHNTKDVLLYESNPYVRELWEWLIADATEQLIKDIPINLKEGMDIRELGLERGQSLLLKHWQRTNNVGHCWTISPWGDKPGQWTANTRARIAEQFAAVSHWKIGGINGLLSFNNSASTWFIDPPYEYNYKYGSSNIDYPTLGAQIKRCKGQLIVCEAVCPKTGAIPTYLPFQFWANRITSRRKVNENHHSKELIWTETAL